MTTSNATWNCNPQQNLEGVLQSTPFCTSRRRTFGWLHHFPNEWDNCFFQGFEEHEPPALYCFATGAMWPDQRSDHCSQTAPHGVCHKTFAQHVCDPAQGPLLFEFHEVRADLHCFVCTAPAQVFTCQVKRFTVMDGYFLFNDHLRLNFNASTRMKKSWIGP